MAALTLPLLTVATIEEKKSIVLTNTIPDTLEDHKIFRKIWIQASSTLYNQHRRWRGDRKILNGKEWLGLDICYSRSDLWFNFELRTDKAVVAWHQISFKFSMCHVPCIVGKTRDFPDLRINEPVGMSEAIDNICMWKESQTFGFFSTSGLGAIWL